MAGMAVPMLPTVIRARQESTPEIALVDQIVIDLPAEPVNIHPAKAYSDIEWSIVHSVFDALIGFDESGEIAPIAADTFELIDETSWEVKLRSGMTFHDGSPVTSDAIVRGFDLVTWSDSLFSDIFGVVDAVEVVDELTARIIVTEPSPWLPAQMASSHVLIPENFDPGKPIGSGPFRFEEQRIGEDVSLTRFDDNVSSPIKGAPIAERVVYHFVPDATTRVSNILSGSSDIASFLPVDSIAAAEEGGSAMKTSEVAGTWFIRIANDAAPFDDPRVRRALNLALDLDAFVGVLVHEGSQRLASLFPPVGMGFDDSLAPFAYDPDAARALLEEAGFGDGIETRMEVSTDASLPMCEAIVGQWAEVGINVELVVSDLGTFNAGWTDSETPPLRMASWSPVFDPSTLLNLVWRTGGILSRYSNEEADALIEEGASMFGDERTEAYRQLGTVLHDDAAGVFLWNLMHVAAVTEKAEAWTPRPDQWIMALAR